MPLDRPVVCPVVVGREPYLESLRRSLTEAAAGRGRAVLVSGEAGVGKSRLVAEARRSAEDAGLRALQGNSFEPDRSLPYGPFLDLLRAFFGSRAPSEVVRLLGPEAPELTRILPEISRWLPEVAAAPALEPEQEKRRLFHALAQLVVRLASTE